jgi:hypothetical protein
LKQSLPRPRTHRRNLWLLSRQSLPPTKNLQRCWLLRAHQWRLL